MSIQVNISTVLSYNHIVIVCKNVIHKKKATNNHNYSNQPKHYYTNAMKAYRVWMPLNLRLMNLSKHIIACTLRSDLQCP